MRDDFYELILHDYGNLAFQVIDYGHDREALQSIADKINFLINNSGVKTIEAQVYIGEYDEINNTSDAI